MFLVSSFLETTFDKKPFDLRDKRVLKFERDKVDALVVTRGKDTIRLKREGSDWKVEQPIAGRGDYSAIEGLLTRLSTAGMSEIVDGNAADLKKFGLDQPGMTHPDRIRQQPGGARDQRGRRRTNRTPATARGRWCSRWTRRWPRT